MVLHVVALPHVSTNKQQTNLACAYTQKIVKFCPMMHKVGWEVKLYGTTDNETPCDEFVSCLSQERRDAILGDQEWYQKGEVYGVDWEPTHQLWQEFNANVCAEMHKRIRPDDLILFITGRSAASIMDAFPLHRKCEFGIGYEGVMPKTHHVYESYAWQASMWAYEQGTPAGADGRYFDAVIPNYFELNDFPVNEGKRDTYFLFMNRMTASKYRS